MATQTRLNDSIDAYQIIEVAARGDRSLFLAIRNQVEGFYWLLESDTPFDGAPDALDGALFDAGERHYFAFEVSAPSLATLLNLTPRLDPAFVGWRWVRLVDSLGTMHRTGQTLSRPQPLSLSSLRFTRASHLTLAMDARPDGNADQFVAPEARTGTPTPPADVYTLSALLWAVIGDVDANRSLATVLAKATATDPLARPADGHALAQALKKALPRRAVGDLGDEPVAAERNPDRTVFGMLDGIIMALGPVAAFGILVAGLLLFRDRVPGLDLSRLPFFGSDSGADASSGGRPRARGTPVPLPAGPLAFGDYKVELDAPCSVRLESALTKGGAPLPNGAAVDFDVWLNGRPMSGVVVAPSSEINSSQWSLAFSAPCFCPGGGAIRVRARAGDGESELSVCEFGQPSDAVGVVSLQNLTIVGAQVDTTSFPALTAYFTAINADSAGTRLHGSFRCSLAIDGAPVNSFTLSAVDSQASPVTVALAMDVSGSMRGAPLLNAKAAAGEFVRQIGAGSAICLYSFSTTVKRLTTCTTERAVVLAALDGLIADGNTALRDVIISIAANQRQLGGRQAVIVLTDGADTASRASLSDMLAQVQQLNVPIYTIGLINPDLTPDVLRQISGRTGGGYLETPDAASLKDLYEKVRGQLATQYQVRFDSPAPDRKNGSFTFRVMDRERSIELTRDYTSAP